jgi:hypothetical protein
MLPSEVLQQRLYSQPMFRHLRRTLAQPLPASF